ncbi:hypothetical protein [Natronolimnobius baerhuensis]|uniref:Uncharacterized protein n=1 Tax=Natronolimnobius baerhuensis TaxID=253108 RepID=A0A202EAQ4_9EURY|nr:hypothetical protein [Natronolimnobius baerhuensis]OVE85321.1 hypothetical protein B2G88_00380 [Natronolimnobius baerhuensis]
MSHAPSPTPFEKLSGQIEAGTERLLREAGDGSDGTLSASNETVSETAAELWDVVDEFEDLLETVDLEKLPDAVDVSALPDLIDLAELPAAIRESDPDLMLDLSQIRRAIHLRELWNAVDLVDFGSELRQLKDELEDVIGPDALASSGAGESDAVAEVKQFVDDVKPEATNAAIQQEVAEGTTAARKAVVEGHSRVEDLYESNQRGSGYAGRRPVSKNPTAVSLVPHGPLPASISTRVSTVPTNVRGAAVDAPRRIYARRWRTVGADKPK